MILTDQQAEKRYKELRNGTENEGKGYFYIDGLFQAFKVENQIILCKLFTTKIEAHKWVCE